MGKIVVHWGYPRQKEGLAMRAFLEWTAWTMEKPVSYGAFHLIATFLLLMAAVGGAYHLRKVSDRGARLVLGITGGVLLLTEVYKIAFHMIVNPYDWGFFGCFPFQLCSVPMYLSLFCALCRNEKLNSWLYEFMFAINMFGGIMAFIEPSGINHPYWTLTIHAYVWHMALIFIGLFLYFSKRACVDRGTFKKSAVVYLISCGVAQAFNLIFPGEVNCFYISPYKQSPLAVFKDIYANFGWIVNMVLLILALLIASALVCYVGYFFRTRKKTVVNV